jgi:subtilase family serine protease
MRLVGGRSLGRKLGIAGVAMALLAATGVEGVPLGAAGEAIRPVVSDWQLVSAGTTPPTQAQCASVNRRCFDPISINRSYNEDPLFGQGLNGSGQTIAIVEAIGSETIRHDLHVFDQAFGVQAMCGEEGVMCHAGMPTFTEIQQGTTSSKPDPATSMGAGLQSRDVWALETSLDVEWAHSVAPGANIVLLTSPPNETLGVQGFPNFMKAEEMVVQNHLAGVISQSFASTEEAFHSTQSLLNLRFAFEDAQAAGITVLGSSGDTGTANTMLQPIKNPTTVPFPTVNWPASDPLVTGVGGTYLCTDPTTGASVDSVSPPATCGAFPGVRELSWVGSGGGYSHVFSRPSFQDTLPAGSTPIPSTQRGVPDVAYQASARTGVLVYITNPGSTGIVCPGGQLCSSGWYVVGGTSSGAPQWAGLVAVADQINGGPLGWINPALYKIGADPTRYGNDFFDVTVGLSNQNDPSIAGYHASTGWDPITGLGTPNAAKLLPDLVHAVHGN